MKTRVTIWDWPLRFFHWLLVASLLSAYLSGSEGGLWLDWHAVSGFFVLSLMCFRFCWGFLGSYHSRFLSFYPSVARLQTYVTSDHQYDGHSPLAALSIFTMLSVIFIQSVSGLFMTDEDIEFYGPLAGLIEPVYHPVISVWHETGVDLILFLIMMHLLAVAYYHFFKNRDIIVPMLTGKKVVPENMNSEAVGKFKFKGLMISIFIAVITFWILNSCQI